MYQLTQTQREILRTLVDLYEHKQCYVKSREIAERIGRDEGTVRNVVLVLKSLNMVSSKTGPEGGYIPTLKAYEAIRSENMPQDRHDMQLFVDEQPLRIWVTSIEILDPLSPEGGRIILRTRGDISALSLGDRVRLGPPGGSRLMLDGRIVDIDPGNGQILVVAERFASIPSESVGRLASRSLIMLSPNISVAEAARILYSHGIRGAPVAEEGKVVGIFTMTDLARAVVRGELNAKVSDYMSRKIISIRMDESLIQAIYLMNKHGVGRLMVVDHGGSPLGIITRTDILRKIAGFY